MSCQVIQTGVKPLPEHVQMYLNNMLSACSKILVNTEINRIDFEYLPDFRPSPAERAVLPLFYVYEDTREEYFP